MATTEHFLLLLFDDTGSPEAFGSWSALAWVGGLPGFGSPILNSDAEPTVVRAVAELVVAKGIFCTEPYPAASWWQEQGISADDVPSREFWDVHTRYESTRAIARGAAMGIGWALGTVEPDGLAPRHYEDGSLLTKADQAECVVVLRELAARPKPPPRLRLARRTTPPDPRMDWRAPEGGRPGPGPSESA